MTASSHTTWTTHDLELYRDEALDPAVAARLSESLRESPELRERLAQVARVDALARATLLVPAPARSTPPPLRIAFVGLAATLLLAAVAFITWQTRRPTPTPEQIIADSGPSLNTPPVAPVAAQSDAMIVFSFPVTARTEPAPSIDPPTIAAESRRDAPATRTPPPFSPRRFAIELDAALARGDAATAANLLSTTDPELRAQAYQRLASTLRSVNTARRVLEALPLDDQLAACRQLAHEPRWRTVTYTQLTTLRTDPQTQDAVEALLAELARTPDLAPLVERIRATPPPPLPRNVTPIDRSL